MNTPDWLPPLSATTIGIGLVTIVALWAIIRGVLRLLRSVLALSIGFAVGAYTFINAPEWLSGLIDNPNGKILGALSFITGALGHLGSNFVFNKVLSSWNSDDAPGNSLPKGQAALFSLIPSSLLLWIGGLALRLTGSFTGLAQADTNSWAHAPFVHKITQTVKTGWLGTVFEAIDPISDRERDILCQLLIQYRDGNRWENVTSDRELYALIQHPQFQRLLNDRDVRHAVAHQNYARLLTLPEVKKAATDRELMRLLRATHAHRPSEIRRAEPIREKTPPVRRAEPVR